MENSMINPPDPNPFDDPAMCTVCHEEHTSKEDCYPSEQYKEWDEAQDAQSQQIAAFMMPNKEVTPQHVRAILAEMAEAGPEEVTCPF